MIRILTIIAASVLIAIAYKTITAQPPRILINDVTYSREQLEMSMCVSGGGKAYFVPDDNRTDGTLTRYAGCNLQVLGAYPK